LANQEGHELFVFDFGAFVSWGVEEEEYKMICNELQQMSRRTIDKAPSFEDQFSYILGSETKPIVASNQGLNINFILKDEEISTTLPISYALAQGVKLDYLEYCVDSVYDSVKSLPAELGHFGKTSLSQKEITKKMGNILSMRALINVDDNANLRSNPDIFWDNEDQEELWYTFFNYLDIKERVNFMDKQLEALNTILEVLRTESQVKHSSMLEKTIIALISIEVAFGLFDHSDLIYSWFS